MCEHSHLMCTHCCASCGETHLTGSSGKGTIDRRPIPIAQRGTPRQRPTERSGALCRPAPASPALRRCSVPLTFSFCGGGTHSLLRLRLYVCLPISPNALRMGSASSPPFLPRAQLRPWHTEGTHHKPGELLRQPKRKRGEEISAPKFINRKSKVKIKKPPSTKNTIEGPAATVVPKQRLPLVRPQVPPALPGLPEPPCPPCETPAASCTTGAAPMTGPAESPGWAARPSQVPAGGSSRDATNVALTWGLLAAPLRL